jgi:hypothetical protein
MAKLYNNKWMGETVSEYGIEHGRIDYRCLAHVVGDRVLCNDITKLFYNDVCGEYSEPEQENGFIDNSETIEFKREQIETLEETRDNSEDPEQIDYINGQIEIIEEQIEELEREQDEQPEIYQYYIISDNGADFLKRYTNEIVYYLDALNIYIWGVTHWGTSWDYVLTDIKIETEGE